MSRQLFPGAFDQAEEVEVIDEPANRTSTSGVWIQGENVTFLCINSLGAYENEEEA